jgi:helicase MOV-10
MAGDYNQLGPHLVSRSSKLHGLDQSIMERLARLPLYSHGPSGLKLELVKNYRSHPAILDFPSKQFYNGKLSAHANPAEVNALCGWKRLPNPKFPLLFFGTPAAFYFKN